MVFLYRDDACAYHVPVSLFPVWYSEATVVLCPEAAHPTTLFNVQRRPGLAPGYHVLHPSLSQMLPLDLIR